MCTCVPKNNYLLNVTQVDQLKKRCKVETRKWKTGQKIGHYANLHFIYEREGERDEQVSAICKRIMQCQNCKLLQPCTWCMSVCVLVTVRMRNVRKRKRWRWPSLVKAATFRIPRKKNLIIIWVWEFLCGRFANESFLVVGWLVAFFRNSVRFSMGYSKDLCVLKESVWKWKWFAINKLKYQRDDNSNNNSSRRIIIQQ